MSPWIELVGGPECGRRCKVDGDPQYLHVLKDVIVPPHISKLRFDEGTKIRIYRRDDPHPRDAEIRTYVYETTAEGN